MSGHSPSQRTIATGIAWIGSMGSVTEHVVRTLDGVGLVGKAFSETILAATEKLGYFSPRSSKC